MAHCRGARKDTSVALTFSCAPTPSPAPQVAVLLQLERIGTAHKVPLILMNYDGFYDNMIKFFGDCVDYGTIHLPVASA